VSASSIRAVALAVFKESVRDRVPYSLVLFSVALMAASFLMSKLTADQDLKVVKDLGLATMNGIGLLIALFIGTGLVAKEVERRSIYAVLTKPVTRTSFLLGKFAGLVLTLAVNLAMMTVAYYAMLYYQQLSTLDWVQKGWHAPAADPRLLLPIALMLVQLMVVTAVALLFSTFSSPLLAVLLTLGVWIAGQFSTDLRDYQQAVDAPAAAAVAKAVYYLLPNLAALDVKNAVVHGLPVPAAAVAAAVGAAGLYIALLLTIASAIFARRDFK
jgi:ABC-type transport system involved in multi-copper enzyme maturation permease subunit